QRTQCELTVLLYRLTLTLPLIVVAYFLFITKRPPPSSTLFPYTTLFRSRCSPEAGPRSAPAGYRPAAGWRAPGAWSHWPREPWRSEEHTSELQSQSKIVCRLLLEKKKHPHTEDVEGTLDQPTLKHRVAHS